MSRLQTIPSLHALDAIPESFTQDVKTDLDYLCTPGADLASAATINPTAEYHKLTGSVTVQTITDTVGAVAGQQVRLHCAAAVTFDCASGNIKSLNGSNYVATAGEDVLFTFDATNWWIAPKGHGIELAYDQITAGVYITGGTSGAPTQIIAGSAKTYDGGPVIVEFFSPWVQAPQGASFAMQIGIWLDGAFLTEIAALETQTATPYNISPILAKARLTPAAGSHTYAIKAWVSGVTGSPIVNAGSGAAGNLAPAFLRVTKV